MKRGEPITHEELKELCDKWFPLFNEVHSRLPEGTTVDEALKVMESLSKLAGAKVTEKEREAAKFFYYRGSGWPES